MPDAKKKAECVKRCNKLKTDNKKKTQENVGRCKLGCVSDGHLGFTSEPIPDYIMRALQPKVSVHPKYGKLRY